MNELIRQLLDIDRLEWGAQGVVLGFERPLPAWAWGLIVAAALGLAFWSYSRLVGPRPVRWLLASALSERFTQIDAPDAAVGVREHIEVRGARVEAEPHHAPHHADHERDRHEGQFVAERPLQHLAVSSLEQDESVEETSDGRGDKEEVPNHALLRTQRQPMRREVDEDGPDGDPVDRLAHALPDDATLGELIQETRTNRQMSNVLDTMTVQELIDMAKTRPAAKKNGKPSEPEIVFDEEGNPILNLPDSGSAVVRRRADVADGDIRVLRCLAEEGPMHEGGISRHARLTSLRLYLLGLRVRARRDRPRAT